MDIPVPVPSGPSHQSTPAPPPLPLELIDITLSDDDIEFLKEVMPGLAPVGEDHDDKLKFMEGLGLSVSPAPGAPIPVVQKLEAQAGTGPSRPSPIVMDFEDSNSNSGDSGYFQDPVPPGPDLEILAVVPAAPAPPAPVPAAPTPVAPAPVRLIQDPLIIDENEMDVDAWFRDALATAGGLEPDPEFTQIQLEAIPVYDSKQNEIICTTGTSDPEIFTAESTARLRPNPDLHKARLLGLGIDVIIICLDAAGAGTKLYAHQSVLSQIPCIEEKLRTESPPGPGPIIITVQNTDPAALDHFIQYLYLLKLNFGAFDPANPEVFYQIMKIADIFDIEYQMVWKIYAQALSAGPSSKIYQITLQYLRKYITRITRSKEFREKFTYERIVDLFTTMYPDLTNPVIQNFELMRVMTRWICYKKAQRKEFFEKFIHLGAKKVGRKRVLDGMICGPVGVPRGLRTGIPSRMSKGSAPGTSVCQRQPASPPLTSKNLRPGRQPQSASAPRASKYSDPLLQSAPAPGNSNNPEHLPQSVLAPAPGTSSNNPVPEPLPQIDAPAPGTSSSNSLRIQLATIAPVPQPHAIITLPDLFPCRIELERIELPEPLASRILKEPCILVPIIDKNTGVKHLDAFSFEKMSSYHLHEVPASAIRSFSALVTVPPGPDLPISSVWEIGGSVPLPSGAKRPRSTSIFSNTKMSDAVDIFRAGRIQSVSKPPMIWKKNMTSAIGSSCGNYIYVTGGNERVDRTAVEDTNCAGRYNINSWEWELLKYFDSPRSLHESIIVGNVLYIIGGTGLDNPEQNPNAGAETLGGETYLLRSVESLDLSTDPPTNEEWNQMAPLNIPRMFHRVFEYDGKIYVVGGTSIIAEDGPGLDSMEIYDPETNLWSFGPSMIYPRKQFGILKTTSKIWAIGGNSRIPSRLTIEYYDPVQNKWEELLSPKWPEELSRFGQFGSSVMVPGRYVNAHISCQQVLRETAEGQGPSRQHH